MIGVHRHDVVVARHRPVGAELAVLAEVHRLLGAQALEPGPMGVGPEELGIADVEVFQGGGVGLGPCLLQRGVLRNAHRSFSHRNLRRPARALA